MAEPFSRSAEATEGNSKISLCSVIGIDFIRRTVDLVGENSSRDNIPDVPYSAPYMTRDGFGIDFTPAIGDQCYLLEAADGTRTALAFVTEVSTTEGQPDYSAKRRPRNSEDIILNTRDGNFIRLLRGGVLELGASDVCKTTYIPVANVIKDVFVAKHMFSPLGEFVWDHTSVEDVPTKGSAAVVFKAKKYVNDKVVGEARYKVELAFGDLSERGLTIVGSNKHAYGASSSLDANKDGTVSFLVSDEAGTDVLFSFQIADDGSFLFTSKQLMSVEVRRLAVKVAESFEVTFPSGSVTGDASGMLRFSVANGAGLLTMAADGSVAINAPALAVNISGAVLTIGPTGVQLAIPPGFPLDLGALGLNIADGAPAILNVSELLPKLLNHTHKVVVPTAAALVVATPVESLPSEPLASLSGSAPVLQSKARMR